MSAPFPNQSGGYVADGVDNMAFQWLKQEGFSRQDRATLQEIKHSNDMRLNPSFPSNRFWGPEDKTAEAMAELNQIWQRRQGK